MSVPITDTIIQCITEADHLYHHLIVLVAPSGFNKTAILQEVHQRTSAPIVNVNLKLAQELLDLPVAERRLEASNVLDDIIKTSGSDVVLLDNIELLFDATLQIDPILLLKRISRSKTIVVTWGGSSDKSYLYYASPDHPEYKKYSIKDFLVVKPEATITE